MAYYCGNCGGPLNNNDRFCGYCGSPVNRGQAPQPGLPKKKKKRSGLVCVLVVAACLVLAGLVGVGWYLFSGFHNITLSNFSSDETYLLSGEENHITFTVEVSGSPKSVNLYDQDGEEIGKMLDDGEDGDAEAEDGIYTCRVEIEDDFDELTVREYYCGIGRKTSEPVKLHFFAPLSEKKAEKAKEVYTEVVQKLFEAEADYADQDGFVDPADVDAILEEAEDIIADAFDEEDICLYEVGESSIYIKFASGLGVVYMPRVAGVSSGGTEVELSYSTYQPNPDIATAVLSTNVGIIAAEFDAASASYSGEGVTLELVKDLPGNQVIMWNGHGGYGPIVKSFLATGEYFDWDAWWWDLDYYFDCVTDRVICRSTEDQADLACVTSKFIDHYCGDLSNDLIVLMSCHSGQDSRLANAFLGKGATAVVGFTDSVYTSYALNLGFGTLAKMTNYNPDTEELYTLSEALATQQAIYGDDDLDWANANSHLFVNDPIKSNLAAPVIFGGTDAYDYQLSGEVPTGIISGQVCEAKDRVTPIAGATVRIYYEDTLFASVTTNANGNYEIELPHGSVTVVTSAENHLEFSSRESVTANQTTYVETFLMIEGQEDQTGTAGGVVYNSLTGIGTPGVQMRFTAGWNNTAANAEVLATAVTGSDGSYTVELNLGNYTAIVSKDGYVTNSFNIIVQEGHTAYQDGLITPEVAGDDYLITLTWGENPRDVDSHMYGTLSSGSAFHVYYNRKNQYDGQVQVCNLDYDDTQSYGPEHITLSTTTGDAYYYYVHRYAGSGTLASSGAMVTIEQNNIVIAEYHVPTNLGNGDYWNVFAIVDGQIVTRNTITGSPDTTYADANS